jgi:alkanesulfonate monooxygenase SsuD/methylene tetrahydromethanopterin reductase-like flavin-dependent oxidoreductase (luciferase family)
MAPMSEARAKGSESMEFSAFMPGHWTDHDISAKQHFDDMLAQAQYADEAGYDVVWLAEHYTLDYIAMPDPLQFAALILDRTKRIKAGIAIIILRNYHPIKLAAQIAQIDVMSGGRFVAGLGRGASGYEFRQMGLLMDPEDSRDYFHEHVGIMS